MICYETLMLVRPDASTGEIERVEQHIEKLIVKAGGKLQTVDRWGKLRLAYPIQHYTYGVYTLIRFELPEEKLNASLKELAQHFRIKAHDVVMRHISVRLESGFVEYKKPEPIDTIARSERSADFRKASVELREVDEEQGNAGETVDSEAAGEA